MKFMHIADVHLGAAPDAGYPWSRFREQELWETFEDTIADAARHQVDLLLIAGDLFHRPPTGEQLKRVDEILGKLENTRVVLMTGNHDYAASDSAWRQYRWQSPVECFLDPRIECVQFPDIQTRVYALGYDRQEITEPLYDGLRCRKGRELNILMAHGGDARHIPISRQSLEESGFDYIALGHIHRPGSLIKGRALYAGALEPIDSADTGPHGYVLGETTGHHVRLRYIRKSRHEYRTLRLECSEEDTTLSLKERLAEEIESEGPQHIYMVELTGLRRGGISYDLGVLEECGRVLYVTDCTRPALHLEELKRRYHGQMIGRFIESFEDHEMDEREEKALQYGLEELLRVRH